MKKPTLIVGLGQLGSVFAEAFLKVGHPVFPLLRGQSIKEKTQGLELELLLVAVGEDDLDPVLKQLPASQLSQLVLLQNELRPLDWQEYFRKPKAPQAAALPDSPSVAIVWFEKKPAKLAHPVLPSVLYGSAAALLKNALDQLALPCRIITEYSELEQQLVLKNLYILGLNFAGLMGSQQAQELLHEAAPEFDKLFEELFLLESSLLKEAGSQTNLDKQRLKDELKAAILADPTHGCAGRSAPARLTRTLRHGRRLGLKLPILESLAASTH